VEAAVDGPHAFFGVAPGGASAASAALRTFIVQHVRGGRPLRPLVTYNTWFAHGVEVDEASMRHEMDGAASLGAELFVLDAGWYTGAGRGGAADFSSGLGSWQVDSNRFPNGLRSLVEYAHGRGLKFGLWVEPESVALSTLNKAGLAQESWMAKAGGKYGSTVAGLICLGTPAARQWVLDQVIRLIDQVGPDYLKWDNNVWVNCDRAGHVHNGTDGNFAHVNGLYQILAGLRARYPDLLIENVSGGGNRLDLGMLRYSDVAWMDDLSAPSARVRHNLEGLSAIFPPAYLLSFAMNGPDESLHDGSDLRLYVRSRMPGVLGLCYRIDDLDEGDQAVMRHQIGLYKFLRETLGEGTNSLLTSQAAVNEGPAWDAIQTTASGNRPTTLWAFQSDPAVSQFTVKLTGLDAETIYEVISVDRGRLGFVPGADLMSRGVRLLGSAVTDAHVLIFRPTPR
jgi:alpha-galactosidase